MDGKLKHWYICINKNFVGCSDTLQVMWYFSHPQQSVQRHKTQHSRFTDYAYDHSLKCGFDLRAVGSISQSWLQQRVKNSIQN